MERLFIAATATRSIYNCSIMELVFIVAAVNRSNWGKCYMNNFLHAALQLLLPVGIITWSPLQMAKRYWI